MRTGPRKGRVPLSDRSGGAPGGVVAGDGMIQDWNECSRGAPCDEAALQTDPKEG